MLCHFSKASCVVVGTFNIYVVQPSLLKALGILTGAELPLRIEANFTQPGFRYTSPSLSWIVRPDQVIVETTDPQKDCGTDVATVLGALQWTPVTAIGSNAEYTSHDLSGSELAELLESFRSRWIRGGHDIEQVTFHASVRREKHIFNLQVAQVENRFEVACNVHTEIKGKDVSGASEFCQSIAANFMGQRQEAGALIREMFSIEVSDEPDSRQGIRDQESTNRESA